LIELGNEEFVTLWRNLADIYEKGLIRRAGKGAEKVEEVLFTSRTCRDQLVCTLEIRLKSIELQSPLSEKHHHHITN